MSFPNNYKNKILGSVLFLFLFISVIWLQHNYDKIVHPNILFTTETRYIMPASVVKNFSFGFRNVLADFYWVSIIQDFSIWDGKDPFYLREYENLSTLDPKFAYPYLLGILTFTSKGVNNKNFSSKEASSNVETIEPIAQIGMKNLPDNWEIPFYMGTAFQLTKTPDKALYYLKIAASKPNIPDSVRSVYNSYLRNLVTGDNASKAFVQTIYETTESKTTKKILKEGIIIKDLTQVIEVIVKNYKTKYGVYPTSIDDLVQNKMIRVGTELKNEFNIKIDKNTGNVEITSKTSN